MNLFNRKRKLTATASIPIHPKLESAQLFARVLDTSFGIPFTNFKIGVDPILGLLPGVGDGISMLLSLYIVKLAWDMHTPIPLLVRMIINVIADTFVGAIPIVGDVADAFWKCNMKNVALMEEYWLKTGHRHYDPVNPPPDRLATLLQEIPELSRILGRPVVSAAPSKPDPVTIDLAPEYRQTDKF